MGIRFQGEVCLNIQSVGLIIVTSFAILSVVRTRLLWRVLSLVRPDELRSKIRKSSLSGITATPTILGAAPQ